jgi:enterochelin esterase-like enzyme
MSIMTGTRLLPDGSVLFEFHYDNAEWVGVIGSFNNWQPWPMSQAENGVWYLKTGTFPDGEFEYQFLVNGDYPMKDQFNARENSDRSNSVIVKGWGRGQFFRRNFYTPALGKSMPYCVYLPPSYFTEQRDDYPVLYLQGGLMDGCQCWSQKGNIEDIADQLMGSGEICEMVIINNEKDDACFAPEDWDRYATYLSHDLVSHVESEYRVSRNCWQRGIDGLSLGAGWSLRLGSWRPDFYTSVGALSGSASKDIYHSVLRNKETIFKYQTRFQQVVGYEEGDIVDACAHFNTFMQDNGIPCKTIYRHGDHDWPLWKDGLCINLYFHSENFSRY